MLVKGEVMPDRILQYKFQECHQQQQQKVREKGRASHEKLDWWSSLFLSFMHHYFMLHQVVMVYTPTIWL